MFWGKIQMNQDVEQHQGKYLFCLRLRRAAQLMNVYPGNLTLG